MTDQPTGRGQNIIIKYLQQILLVAVISFGGYLFTLIMSMGTHQAELDKQLVLVEKEIQDLREDVNDDERLLEEFRQNQEDTKDNLKGRIIKLEDLNDCITKKTK
jgi:Ca2+/H+ antiporter